MSFFTVIEYFLEVLHHYKEEYFLDTHVSTEIHTLKTDSTHTIILVLVQSFFSNKYKETYGPWSDIRESRKATLMYL